MSDILHVSEHPIDLNAVHAALSDPRFGAQLVFAGIVRNVNDGRPVEAVSYESFVVLAEQTFSDLAREVREQVGGPLKVVLIHRTGRLSVGEISTIVGVAAPHRAECYSASRYLLEQLKVRVPVWKEEHYANGDGSWLAGTELVP